MNSLYVFGLLSLIASLTASPTVGDSSPVFDSEQQAVKAAADIYNPLSIRTDDREYMGSIYNAGRESTVIPCLWENAVPIPWQSGFPGRTGITWLPCGTPTAVLAPNHRYFSDIDTEVVQRFALPFYLADYTSPIPQGLPPRRQNLAAPCREKTGITGGDRLCQG